jgi:hypothetical protein
MVKEVGFEGTFGMQQYLIPAKIHVFKLHVRVHVSLKMHDCKNQIAILNLRPQFYQLLNWVFKNHFFITCFEINIFQTMQFKSTKLNKLIFPFFFCK